MGDAVGRARAGTGPILVECLMDEAVDPLEAVRHAVEHGGMWDAARHSAALAVEQAAVDEAISAALHALPPEPYTLFSDCMSSQQGA
jgi:TPP-dependent pyruvate/acetoin dehydrogenase alpha subunit